MTEHGVLLYDLAGNWCGECGRPKLSRLLGYGLTGCPECDEVITRHRCHLPSAAAAAGTQFTCRECRSAWVLVTSTEPCGDCCAECGHKVTVRQWEITGDRRVTGPRREPCGYSPMRNLIFPGYPVRDLEAEERDRAEWVAGVAERLGLVLMSEDGRVPPG